MNVLAIYTVNAYICSHLQQGHTSFIGQDEVHKGVLPVGHENLLERLDDGYLWLLYKLILDMRKGLKPTMNKNSPELRGTELEAEQAS